MISPPLAVARQKVECGRLERIDCNVGYGKHRQAIGKRRPGRACILRAPETPQAACPVRADQDAGSTGQFVIPQDKRILASYLGMEAESLSRNLASLAALGVVVRGRHISLTDYAALARLAGV